MDHQNWDYTVFEGQPKHLKGKNQEQTVNKAIQSGSDVLTTKKAEHVNKHNQIQGAQIAKILNDEDEKYTVETVSHDLRIAIMQARQEKGLT